MTKTEIIFKNNLIFLRTQREISAYRVATDLKIDKGYYYRLENMNKSQSPTYELLEKLADYYGLEVYELFKNMQ